jgi:hypothetical protein
MRTGALLEVVETCFASYFHSCSRPRRENWRIGELENWRIGELENWRIGELGNWGIGELGNWGIGELGNWGIGELGNWGQTPIVLPQSLLPEPFQVGFPH